MVGLIAGAMLIAYLSICLLLRSWQTRFIFFPTKVFRLTPGDLGANYEEVRLSGPEGETLHGWWLPAAAPARGTILYCHGNGSNISGNLEAAYRFVGIGFNVLLFDYRGYGQSGGNFPTEAQVYEDAAVALDYLLQERELEPGTIILYGHSLGGAVAIDLALRYPQVGGLIAESTFTSMEEMVDRAGIYSFFPVGLLLVQRFDSQQKIPSLKIPALYIHGTADPTVPHAMSQRLFEATPGQKRLLLVPGAGHNNVASLAGEEYLQAVRSFAQLLESGSETARDRR